MTETETRCGFVALIGEPNAGKSTLMNRMVGSKVSIVTHKVQTTRSRLRGIAQRGQTQMIFVDTPGLFRTRRKLDRAMVAAAWTGAADADVVVLLVEAHRGITKGVEMILEGLATRSNPKQVIGLVINKIDRVKSPELLALTKELNERYDFAETFLVSAERGHGVVGLEAWLEETLPVGPWHYPEDQIADVPMRMIAAEITREKLMLRLHQELPYQLTVETEQWTEKKDGSVRIDQVIYVARDGHKGIALGPKGETIKGVSMAARKELAEMMGRPVHLFLQVKVRPNWENEAERYSEMGLDFSDTK
jgi:GTP-binding protein Era